jgi:multicomponent Na+:H+ antiporter subunit E
MTRRITLRLPVVLSLTLLWLLLWGDVTPLLIAGGVVVAIVVINVFPFPPVMWRGSVRPWALVVLVSRFAADLVRASVAVMWLSVRPAAPPPSAVIRVDLATRSELLLTLTAELVSLVPGSLLIDLDPPRGAIWLHVLDARSPAHVERARRDALAQERRVIAAFGSSAERALCTEGDRA